MITRSANTFRDGASPGSRDLHEVRIRADLIEHREEALGFGEKPVVHVRLELQQCVVDTQAIVFYSPLQQDKVALLPGKALENLHELGSRGIERVIERCFVDFGVPFVPESFLAQIRDFLLDIQITDIKIFQVGGKLENLLAHRRADFKRLRVRIFFKLADIKRAFALIADFDLSEFRCAALEDAAIGNRGRARSGTAGRHGNEREREQKKAQPSALAQDACHRSTVIGDPSLYN